LGGVEIKKGAGVFLERAYLSQKDLVGLITAPLPVLKPLSAFRTLFASEGDLGPTVQKEHHSHLDPQVSGQPCLRLVSGKSVEKQIIGGGINVAGLGKSLQQSNHGVELLLADEAAVHHGAHIVNVVRGHVGKCSSGANTTQERAEVQVYQPSMFRGEPRGKRFTHGRFAGVRMAQEQDRIEGMSEQWR
jgi:hypothetical protein